MRLIAGGTGFIGTALIEHWLSQKIAITVLGRDEAKITAHFTGRVTALSWEEFEKNPSRYLREVDCVVNLCGANIGEKRWSDARRKEILESRISPTEKIAAALAPLGHAAPRLLNASAIGVYGLSVSQHANLPPAVDEHSALPNPPSDFLSEVAQAWEQATERATVAGVRVVNLRFAVVLADHGGALAQLALPFRYGLGAVIGCGDQPFSWITLHDVIRAIDFITRHDVTGPINLVSVQAISQREFAHTLARALHRPCLFRVPEFILKIALGEMAEELILKGQHVVPTRLRQLGFNFDFPDLAHALDRIYR